MAVLPIRTYPDPVLRKVCREVTRFDGELRRLSRDMVETMLAAPGIGLAAPQVGSELRLVVVDTSVGKEAARLRTLVNPRVVEQDGQQVDLEACLSLPGLSEKVERPQWVRVEAQDLDGAAQSFEAEALEARVICHELDHLEGVLFVDRLRGLRRERARRQLRKQLAAHEEANAVAAEASS